MGDRYKIFDQQAVYFITLTIVEWIDTSINSAQVFLQGRNKS